MRLIAVLLVMSVSLFAMSEEAADRERMEETGESGVVEDAPRYHQKAPSSRGPVLLIPDSFADVVGMFDPYDGTYWGDFIVDDTTGLYDFSTPINAMQIYPEGPVMVSDQYADAVYGFDEYGDFMYVVGDDTYLNNVRGIDFRDDTIFVTSGDDYVAMFDAPGSFAGYFIQDGTNPFDILFVDEVESGSALLTDIQGTTDNVRHYYADGSLIGELFNVNFPEQVVEDVGNPGNYLVASFSDNVITQFLIDGTIIDTWTFDGGRGVFRLGNGNLLATNGTGVHEIDVSTGAILETEYYGQCRFIELASLPGVPIGETPSHAVLSSELSLTPNPFHGQLSIGFSLAQASDVEIDIYSIAGRVVRSITPGTLGPGEHSMTWDGTSDSGASLGQGVYFVRVTTSDGVISRKVNLLR